MDIINALTKLLVTRGAPTCPQTTDLLLANDSLLPLCHLAGVTNSELNSIRIIGIICAVIKNQSWRGFEPVTVQANLACIGKYNTTALIVSTECYEFDIVSEFCELAGESLL